MVEWRMRDLAPDLDNAARLKVFGDRVMRIIELYPKSGSIRTASWNGYEFYFTKKQGAAVHFLAKQEDLSFATSTRELTKALYVPTKEESRLPSNYIPNLFKERYREADKESGIRKRRIVRRTGKRTKRLRKIRGERPLHPAYKPGWAKGERWASRSYKPRRLQRSAEYMAQLKDVREKMAHRRKREPQWLIEVNGGWSRLNITKVLWPK